MRLCINCKKPSPVTNFYAGKLICKSCYDKKHNTKKYPRYCYLVWSKTKQEFIYVGRTGKTVQERLYTHRYSRKNHPFGKHILDYGISDLIFLELPYGVTEHEYALKYGTYSKCNSARCVSYL